MTSYERVNMLLNKEIPEDISVVSFDEVEDISTTNPFLTVVSQNSYALGVIVTEWLLKRIKGESKFLKDPQDILLQPKLIIRESCATPRAALVEVG